MDTMEFYTKAELSCYFSSVYYFTMQETYSHVRTRKKKKKKNSVTQWSSNILNGVNFQFKEPLRT